jgi:ethanolamine permease
MEKPIAINSLAKPKITNQKSPIYRKICGFGVCMLGLGRLIGVRCKYWNKGFAIDLQYLYLFAALTSVVMIILACSLAEMTSSLPFTGGTYGFARGIYGPYLGFMVGILEILTGLACMAAFIHGFGEACVHAFRLPDNYIVIFFVLMVIFTAGMQSLDALRFSWVSRIFTLIAITLLMIYFFSPLAVSNHGEYTSHPNSSHTGSNEWRDILGNAPTCWFFFTGIEMLPIIAHDSRDPRHSIPVGLLVVTGFSIVATFATYAVSTSQSPGIMELQQSYLPLSYGFVNILNVSVETAMLLNIPFQLVSFMISQYFLCIIIRSMAESGLLPSFFLRNISCSKYNLIFPYYSASLTFTVSTSAAILAWVMDDFSDTLRMSFVYFFSFPYYTLYIALFVTYIIFRKHFSSLPRTFVSPFGVMGAYVAIAITSFFLFATCFYAYNWVAFSIYCLLMGTLSWIYRVYGHRHQTFSGEEEKVFFPTYVIRFNQHHQRKMRKNANLKNQQTLRNIHSPAIQSHSPKSKSSNNGPNSNILTNHYHRENWQSSNSWNEQFAVTRIELPRRLKGMFEANSSPMPSSLIAGTCTVTPPTNDNNYKNIINDNIKSSGNDVIDHGSIYNSNCCNYESVSARMNKVVPLNPQQHHHHHQQQSQIISTNNDKSVSWATSSESSASTTMTRNTKGSKIMVMENIRASLQFSSLSSASEGPAIPPRIKTNFNALVDLESIDHEYLQGDKINDSESQRYRIVQSPYAADLERLQEELTFEEALASNEDDMKFRYIRQHLCQQAMYANDELDGQVDAQENRNRNGPPASLVKSALQFYSSFLFPVNASTAAPRSRSGSQSKIHAGKSNGNTLNNLQREGALSSRATSVDVQSSPLPEELLHPPVSQRDDQEANARHLPLHMANRPYLSSSIELMRLFKWRYASIPHFNNNETTGTATSNVLTEHKVIFQVNSHSKYNEVNKNSSDHYDIIPQDDITNKSTSKINSNNTNAISVVEGNELIVEDIPENV